MKALVKISMVSLLIFSTLYFTSCNHQRRIAGNYTYKTECMGIELDGSQTLKAWGNGRNYLDAVEQAKKVAVNDVLFKGILEGKQECEGKPVLFEVNARDNHADYFNKFFADGGEYKNFVNLKDERIQHKVTREEKIARNSVTHALIVRVLRPQLIAKMKTDGIIK